MLRIIDVAGLLAYLLSIYPSTTFNPSVEQALTPSFSLESTVSAAASSSVYVSIHAALPAWASAYLPKPVQATFGVAPVPSKGITPAQLKAAILELSSPDLLSDIPANTVNLLVFNNATSSGY